MNILAYLLCCHCIGDGILQNHWMQRKSVDSLREKFDNMLAAEVKRHGGIPHLCEEEVAFREEMAAFLEGGKP